MLKVALASVAFLAIALAASHFAKNREESSSVSASVRTEVLEKWKICSFIEGPHGNLDECAKYATRPLNQ